MDGSDVVGATQILATMLVFLAVERRVVEDREKDPEKRLRRIRRDSTGLMLIAVGVLIGGIEALLGRGDPLPFNIAAVGSSLAVAFFMTLAVVGRAWGSMERRSYLQEREDRDNRKHQEPGDDTAG